jgi:hypothetical protein
VDDPAGVLGVHGLTCEDLDHNSVGCTAQVFDSTVGAICPNYCHQCAAVGDAAAVGTYGRCHDVDIGMCRTALAEQLREPAPAGTLAAFCRQDGVAAQCAATCAPPDSDDPLLQALRASCGRNDGDAHREA